MTAGTLPHPHDASDVPEPTPAPATEVSVAPPPGPPPDAAVAREPEERAGAGASSDAAPIRVLLVDDEEPGLMAMKSALADMRVRLDTAQSGRDALRAVLLHDYALILLDVRMPGLDGFETAEMIRTRPRSSQTPIIFLTGAESHMLRAYQFGAVDFLVKPFPADVLRSKVRVFVELAQAREHLVRVAQAQQERAELSEDRYREVLEHASDAILLVDPGGGIVDANGAAERLFGTLRHLLKGRALASLFPGPPGSLPLGVLGEFSRETRVLPLAPTESGPRWAEVSITPVTSGRTPLAMAIVRDVTERHHASEVLEQHVHERTQELQVAMKELEAFSYSVAHDLRAPLRSIIGYTHALGEDYASRLDAGAQRYLELVAAATRRMSQLIDDLLDLSRVSRSPLERQTVDVSALAQGLLEELHERHPDRKVEIVVEDGIAVEADPSLFRLALDNLLSNAWKFTNGRERARIEVIRHPVEPHTLVVRDNGVGFDRRFVHLLFKPFERLHGEEFEGTGVGLAIVDRIVRRHGGEIYAEGRVEEGATFSIRL